jgi:hypothetical protein
MITQEQDKWFDFNNNYWNSKEEAEKYSFTLINCSNCNNCNNCNSCNSCNNCYNCNSCNNCNKIEKDDIFINIQQVYRYTCCPRIKSDGTQLIQMGCFLRTRKEWEEDFWNNISEFPNDNSVKSNKRLLAFKMACMWLDSQTILKHL